MKCAANSVIEVIAPSWLISSFKSPTSTQPSGVPSGATSYVKELWFIPCVCWPSIKNKAACLTVVIALMLRAPGSRMVEQGLQQYQHSYPYDIILLQDERFVRYHLEYPSRKLISLENFRYDRDNIFSVLQYFHWFLTLIQSENHFQKSVNGKSRKKSLKNSWATEFQNHIL